MTEPEFRDSFHRYKDVVYRFAYRMTGSSPEAEDVVQDCFAALWKRPDGFDPRRGELRAYLLGIARKKILKRWRVEERNGVAESEPVCLPLDLVKVERSEAVAAAVQALPPLQREALVLAEYEELALDEIARLTDAELAAVKSRLHRARENLRRMLAPLLEEKGSLYGTK